MDYRLQHATEGYLEFLALGGRIRLADLSPRLVRESSAAGCRSSRPVGDLPVSNDCARCGDDQSDDIRGFPSGRVVIAGYDFPSRKVLVADPYEPNPYGGTREYWMRMERVGAAVLLGIVTHDANLTVIRPRHRAVHPPLPVP